MVANVRNLGKIVIKFLQGSAVTQTMLGGLPSSSCKFPKN